MKLKYYLRGLGIGILVTAVIMGIASGKRQMTDEEVRARAKELGMVESTVLSHIADMTQPDDTEPENKEVDESEPAPMPEESEPEDTPEEGGAADTQEESEAADALEESEPAPMPEESEPEDMPKENDPAESTPVVIVIKSGQSSVSVSKMLAEAGLVKDATAYDKYLCENGYDKKIQTGTYELTAGASEEEIARIITGG
ncbi:MAG: hypothetical protein UFG06_00535 [Lachnospiraceae bacterium]|nr:hypothetical protein [Lachnospiraceae bacterium]